MTTARKYTEQHDMDTYELEIRDNQGRETSIAALIEEFPDLVAYDESGFYVDINDLDADAVATSGYFGPDHRRILLWSSEEDSENDTGGKAVASISITSPATQAP